MLAPAPSGVPGPGETSTPYYVGLIDRAVEVLAQGVVAVHDGLGAELLEVLDEVEHERVVVVQDEDPHRPRLLGAPLVRFSNRVGLPAWRTASARRVDARRASPRAVLVDVTETEPHHVLLVERHQR